MPKKNSRRTTSTPRAVRRGARASAARRGGQVDAISLLKADHARVKKLLKRLSTSSEGAAQQRKALLEEIETELKAHTRVEEELFYPAFKQAAKSADEHLYYEAVEEHHLVDVVLPETKAADVESEQFSAKAKVVQDLVLHHVEEEEGQMFMKARRVMSAAQLRELGEQMQSRKEALQSGLLTRAAQSAGAALGKIVRSARRGVA
jgi:hemerythrin superfamily protein